MTTLLPNGTLVRIVRIDHDCWNGRSPHPGDDCVGMTGVIIGHELWIDGTETRGIPWKIVGEVNPEDDSLGKVQPGFVLSDEMEEEGSYLLHDVHLVGGGRYLFADYEFETLACTHVTLNGTPLQKGANDGKHP